MAKKKKKTGRPYASYQAYIQHLIEYNKDEQLADDDDDVDKLIHYKGMCICQFKSRLPQGIVTTSPPISSYIFPRSVGWT